MSNARWDIINALDEELLKGGVVLSEWCACIVRETDLAFVGGAHLATILTAVAGIESYLRSEHSEFGKGKLVELISKASILEDLKTELHRIRRFRNTWVHVDNPWNDGALLQEDSKTDRELEDMALAAVKALRRTIYENQWV